MIVHNEFKQGDMAWLMARSGIPTASEFDALVSPTFEARKGEMPKTYLAKKVAEAWQGGPLPEYQGFDMDQGQILESEALPWFGLQFGVDVARPGFITTDNGRIGCSPDGIIGESYGVELKCPAAHTHVSYLLKGELPPDYRAQVHGSMYVTGFSEWKFVSYRRHFPQFVLTIKRDDEIQAALAGALTVFIQNFDVAMARLTEINGGPPRRLTPMPEKKRERQEQPHFVSQIPS